MIVLLDASGSTAAAVLTDELGAFIVRAPAAGRFALRADRIGHASAESPPFEVGAGETVVVDLTAPVEAVALAEVRVEGSRRCLLRPEEGMDVARVWEEARKALAAAAWTDDHSVYRYEIARWIRDLDADARRVEREERSYDALVQQRTFVSRPARDLVENGFVQADRDGSLYFAPDAAVLLSDPFLDTHCLRLEEGRDEDAELIGLAFEPVRNRRLPDIEGVLWLDPGTARLRRLDFRYVNIERAARSPNVGGRVVFEGLPGGTWVVREWHIRMPRMAIRRGFTGTRELVLEGIREEGASVLRIREPGGGVLVESETGVVTGVVLDSLHVRPLAGARVEARGTPHADTTGTDGRFRLSGLADGVYRITYTHPLLDEVGWVPEAEEVDVRKGRIAEIRFRTPSRREVLRAACADEERVGGTGMVAGIVRDADGGAEIAGATVRVLWSDFDLLADRRAGGRGPGSPAAGAAVPPGRPAGARSDGRFVVVTERVQGVETTTDGAGRFLFCTVPGDHPIRLEAEHAGARSGVVHSRIPPFEAAVQVDLRVPVPGIRPGDEPNAPYMPPRREGAAPSHIPPAVRDFPHRLPGSPTPWAADFPSTSSPNPMT